jgi:Flp pilus assembly protein TadD
MKTQFARAVACALTLCATLNSPGFAADTQSTPAENEKITDFVIGQKAITAKDWNLAAKSFSRVTASEPNNADAHNLLGYSLRWLNRYDEAFAAYNKALALDPTHKGALEYSGVAYLKTHQKARAEANLARLQAICATCEETTDPARAIAEYKAAVK